MLENFVGPMSGHGTHPWLEIGYWVSQIIIAVVAVLAAAYAFRQLRAVQLFELLRFIQTERMMELRRTVRQEIGPIRATKWWENRELEAVASVVASGYDVLGDYLRNHGPRSLRNFFVKYWSHSIVDTYTILAPYIEMRQQQHDRTYLEGYTWLYNAALPYTKLRKGPVES
jgi:hypothetical protein